MNRILLQAAPCTTSAETLLANSRRQQDFQTENYLDLGMMLVQVIACYNVDTSKTAGVIQNRGFRAVWHYNGLQACRAATESCPMQRV